MYNIRVHHNPVTIYFTQYIYYSCGKYIFASQIPILMEKEKRNYLKYEVEYFQLSQLVLLLFAQIRKTRSLTELINEAEETLSNPINQVSMGVELA